MKTIGNRHSLSLEIINDHTAPKEHSMSVLKYLYDVSEGSSVLTKDTGGRSL